MEPSTVAADDRALLGLLRGLSNPHRFRVFRALCARPLRGKEVSAACGVTPQEASRHLARLTALGLAERRGRTVAASDLGRRVAARLDELRALQALPRQLDGFDLAAVPVDLPLAPLLAAGPRKDPERRAVAEAEREALASRGEVLRISPTAWPSWPLGSAGPRRFGAVLLQDVASPPDLPPVPGGTEADLRLATAPPLWLLITDHGATLVLPREGRLVFEEPFRGADAAWSAWCRRLYEHHRERASLLRPTLRPGAAAPAR